MASGDPMEGYFQSTAHYIRDRYEALLAPKKNNVYSNVERVQVNPAVKKKMNTRTNSLITRIKSGELGVKKSVKSVKSEKSVRTDKPMVPMKATMPVKAMKQTNSEAFSISDSKSSKATRRKLDDWVRPNPLPEATPSCKLAHQLRLAVHLGEGSINPDVNPQLKNILREIWELGMPQEEVHRILRQCKLSTNKLNCYKLQIRYRRNIFLICCVQVGQLLSAKKKLIPILKEYNASFQYAMDLFKNIGLIEAFIKPIVPMNFEDFDSIVRQDAYECKCRALEIIDYTTGSVCFSCNPLYLPNVVKCLQTKGYEIVYTENGFRANLLVDLNWLERSNYTKFVEKLYGVNEITHIYDNVRTIDAAFEPTITVKKH